MERLLKPASIDAFYRACEMFVQLSLLAIAPSGILRANQAAFAEDHIGLTTQIRTAPKLMRPPWCYVIISTSRIRP